MKKIIKGFLFNRIEKLGNKKYDHIGFEDEKQTFRDLLASLVPKTGDRKKAQLTIEILSGNKNIHAKKIVNSNSLSSVKKILKTVKHPAINSTLYDLGMIKDIKLKNNRIIIILAFPFPNIPIKDTLIKLIKKPLVKLKLGIEIKTVVMNKKELQKFLSLEQKNWQGGI